MKQRRLIDTVGMVEHRAKRHDVTGEVLPAVPDTRALVPVAPPARPPVISISLPSPTRLSADDVPVSEYERRKAQRSVTLESDVHVPALQALFTALAFGVMAGLLAWAFSWSWRVPVVVLALTLAVSWLWRLRLVDALLWETEVITGRDLNHDGRIGKPTFAPVIVNPTAARATANQVQRSNEAQNEIDDLLRFVTACANVGCSESAQGIGTSPTARAEFARRRDTLIALGIGRWKDPDRRRIGWELTVNPAEAGMILRRHILHN